MQGYPAQAVVGQLEGARHLRPTAVKDLTPIEHALKRAQQVAGEAEETAVLVCQRVGALVGYEPKPASTTPPAAEAEVFSVALADTLERINSALATIRYEAGRF